jgi:pimeloyl-ACP methyl ester carboxylesterase
MSEIVLIHGGFAPAMGAERFWVEPGICAALRRRGHRVAAPNRVARPTSWNDEAAHLVETFDGPAHVVAGSNGCSVAVRLAIDHRDLVRSLLLCWPATAGDAQVDARSVDELLSFGVDRTVAHALIDTTATLRGVTDAELATLRMAVGIVAAAPSDPAHQSITVERLHAQLPRARSLGAFAVPFHPAFGAQVEALADAISEFVSASGI